MTASPMNFSTVPPSASISARMAAKNAPMTSLSRLGVEPLAERRRAGDVGEQDGDDLALLGAAARCARERRPQPLQKRASGAF